MVGTSPEAPASRHGRRKKKRKKSGFRLRGRWLSAWPIVLGALLGLGSAVFVHRCAEPPPSAEQ